MWCKENSFSSVIDDMYPKLWLSKALLYNFVSWDIVLVHILNLWAYFERHLCILYIWVFI